MLHRRGLSVRPGMAQDGAGRITAKLGQSGPFGSNAERPPTVRGFDFVGGALNPYVGNSQKGPEELKDAAGP